MSTEQEATVSMKNIINNVDVCESDNDDSVELETP
jgi:hypothetical protein